MKKYFVFVLLIFISFTACNDNSNELLNSNLSSREDYLKVSDFDNYGKLHNELLTQAALEFPNGLGSYDSAQFVNIISSFCKELVSSEDIQQKFNYTEEFSGFMCNAFDKTKNQFIVNNPEAFLNSSNFGEKISYLLNNKIISDFYFSILSNIYNDAKLYTNGELSFENFQDKINNYITEFNNHEYSLDSKEGMVLGITLSLSKNSIEWWMNPRNYKAQIQTRIAPWLIADAIGAVLSGGAALASELGEDDDINWWGVAAWTIAGGAGMSIGVKLK